MKNLYIKTTWVDNKTPVNAANLNKIENALVDLYQNAISVSDLSVGKGIDLTITKDKKVEFSVTDDIITSCSCSGIEVVLSNYSFDIDSLSNGIIYFVIDADTKKLKKIIFNGINIYEVE